MAKISVEDYLLAKAAEEASELSIEFNKCIVFGPDSVYEGKTQLEKVTIEFNDLLAVVGMLNTIFIQKYGKKIAVDHEMSVNKLAKVRHYMNVSRELGRLEDANSAN